MSRPVCLARQVVLLLASAILLVSCFPDMTRTTSGSSVPKLEEYNLDPSDFDYENDRVESGSIYVRSIREDSARFVGNALVFNENGAFKEIPVDSKRPTANEVYEARGLRYGLYGVEGDDFVLESYSRPDGFYREVGYVRGDSLCLTGSLLRPHSPVQPFDQDVCHVRTPVEFLGQVPFVYPGQSLLE